MITGVEKRQVFDLPEPRLKVTEHQAMIYRCARCCGQTTAGFPEGVISPAQYGPRVRAAAVYLNVQQLIPEDRVAQAMADLFGAARLCPDGVVAWGKRRNSGLWRRGSPRSCASRGAPAPGRRARGPGAGLPSIETCRPSPERSEPADARPIARDTIF